MAGKSVVRGRSEGQALSAYVPDTPIGALRFGVLLPGGWVALVLGGGPLPSRVGGWQPVPWTDPRLEPYRQALEAYFQGWASVPPGPWVGAFTPFQRAVYEYVRSIPRGETRTYGQVAAAIGRPRAARAVGQALARNPLPLVIPCHRVVASNGDLRGFSAAGGLALKARLLEWERRTRQTFRR